MTIRTRSRAAALAALPLLAACESPQEPEPLEKTMPTAAGIVGVWAAVVLTVVYVAVRWIVRRSDQSIVGSPIAITLLTIVPAVLATAPIVLGVAWVVAFGYQDPTYSLFSWDDTVGIHVVLAGVSVIAIVATAAVAVLATHPNRVVVAVGQFVLAIPTGAMAAGLVATEPSTGSVVGLLCTTPWAVAFLLSWQQRDHRDRAAL